MNEAGLGHGSEIVDAEPPHTPRGCPFQAWSLGELLPLHRLVFPKPSFSKHVVRKLMSTVASLPFFFFTLPAGALADMMDRKRIMFVMTIWLALAAGGLAVSG